MQFIARYPSPAQLLAAIFLGGDLVEDAIGVGDARECQREIADLDVLRDGLKASVDAVQQRASQTRLVGLDVVHPSIATKLPGSSH